MSVEVMTSKDPMAEHKAVVAESDKRPPVAVSAIERDRWQARALRAEGKLAQQQREWLKSADIRARFGWSAATLDRYINAGKFPRPVKWGRTRYWTASDVCGWEVEHLRPAAPVSEGK